MNESIHGERTASELEGRVTELIEQQTAISEVLHAIAICRTTCSPSSTPSSAAPHVSVEQTGSLGLSEESGLRLVAVQGQAL